MGIMAGIYRGELNQADKLDAEGKHEQAMKKRKSVASWLKIKYGQPIVIREYTDPKKAQEEAEFFYRLGYQLAGQSAQGGHINVGRTVTGAVFTGGLSLLFGASRTKGKIQVTYELQPQEQRQNG